jgi:hypothetical protein
MQISLLADHPEYIAALAPPAFEHWQQYGFRGTLADRRQKLREHCQRHKLPSVQTLYLFTLDRQDWYASLGWSALRPCEYAGHPGTIVQKDLCLIGK